MIFCGWEKSFVNFVCSFNYFDFQDSQFLSVLYAHAICGSDLFVFANATFLYFMYLSDNDVSMMATRGIVEMAL